MDHCAITIVCLFVLSFSGLHRYISFVSVPILIIPSALHDYLYVFAVACIRASLFPYGAALQHNNIHLVLVLQHSCPCSIAPLQHTVLFPLVLGLQEALRLSPCLHALLVLCGLAFCSFDTAGCLPSPTDWDNIYWDSSRHLSGLFTPFPTPQALPNTCTPWLRAISAIAQHVHWLQCHEGPIPPCLECKYTPNTQVGSLQIRAVSYLKNLHVCISTSHTITKIACWAL